MVELPPALVVRVEGEVVRVELEDCGGEVVDDCGRVVLVDVLLEVDPGRDCGGCAGGARVVGFGI